MKRGGFGLHSELGVDFLIKCCEDELKNNVFFSLSKDVKNFLIVFIFPITAFFLGRASDEWSAEVVVEITATTIVLLFICFFIYLVIKIPIQEVIGSKHKALLKDLQYIKTLIRAD